MIAIFLFQSIYSVPGKTFFCFAGDQTQGLMMNYISSLYDTLKHTKKNV